MQIIDRGGKPLLAMYIDGKKIPATLEKHSHRRRNHEGSDSWYPPFIFWQLHYIELHTLQPLPIEPPYIKTSSDIALVSHWGLAFGGWNWQPIEHPVMFQVEPVVRTKPWLLADLLGAALCLKNRLGYSSDLQYKIYLRSTLAIFT